MNAAMNHDWMFILGPALLLLLGAVVALRLPVEYRSRLRPSTQTVLAVWALYAVHSGLVALAAAKSTWHFNLSALVAVGGGIVLVVVGTALLLSAATAFRSVKRMSGLDTTCLVTEGIYRWSRNPQNVGWALVLVGAGLLCESGMVLFLALVFWLSFRLYLPLEEELLQRVFGGAYETYRHRTHRYFGQQGGLPQNNDREGS